MGKKTAVSEHSATSEQWASTQQDYKRLNRLNKSKLNYRREFLVSKMTCLPIFLFSITSPTINVLFVHCSVFTIECKWMCWRFCCRKLNFSLGFYQSGVLLGIWHWICCCFLPIFLIIFSLVPVWKAHQQLERETIGLHAETTIVHQSGKETICMENSEHNNLYNNNRCAIKMTLNRTWKAFCNTIRYNHNKHNE